MQAAADAEDINAQEKLFGMASTKYTQVGRMAAKLEPYCGLWTLAARFYDKYAGWMSGPFSKLKPEEVETEVSDAYRKIYKLSKVYRLNLVVTAVCLHHAEPNRVECDAFLLHMSFCARLQLGQVAQCICRLSIQVWLPQCKLIIVHYHCELATATLWYCCQYVAYRPHAGAPDYGVLYYLCLYADLCDRSDHGGTRQDCRGVQG